MWANRAFVFFTSLSLVGCATRDHPDTSLRALAMEARKNGGGPIVLTVREDGETEIAKGKQQGQKISSDATDLDRPMFGN